MTARRITALLVVMALLVPLVDAGAFAQQPPAATQPDLFQEALKTESRPAGPDVYDAAAGVVTVLKVPFNIGLCALGTGVGLAVFALTLGSGYKASTRFVEEGCAQKWVVTGEDLRPDEPRAGLFDP